MTDTQLAQMDNSNVPAFLKNAEVKSTGMEDAGEDKTTPRIQLAQAMSPQVKKKNEDYIEGLEEGMYFNALTGEVLGETFHGSILKVYQTRALFTEDATVDCHSQDFVHGSKHSPLCKDCPLSQWTKDGDRNTPPPCATFMQMVVLPEGAEAPALFGIKRTNKFAIAEARNLNTHLTLHAHMGSYAAMYEFTAKVSQSGKNTWFTPSARPIGFIQDEDQYKALAAMAEQFKDINHMEAQ